MKSGRAVDISGLMDGKGHGDCWAVARTVLHQLGVLLPESAAMEGQMPARVRVPVDGSLVGVRVGDVVEIATNDPLVPLHVAVVLDDAAEVGGSGVRVVEGDQRPEYPPVSVTRLMVYLRAGRVRNVWRAAALEEESLR